MLAQNSKTVNQQKIVPQTKQGIQRVRNCGTPVPSAEWDAMFNGMVDTYKSQHTALANGKIAATTYTIPIIFHVVSYTTTGTVPVGTYPNLSQAQVNSQVAVLNADYAGTGVGVSTYTALTSGGHGPFYDYATGNSLPTPDNTTTGVQPVNTGITFCPAAINPSGVTIPEPGIDRVNAYTLTPTGTYTNTNPAQTSLTSSTFNTFVDQVIKPQTIWDPTKYFNVWVTDCNSSVSLLGYTTFPNGTTLSGLTTVATSTTDGCWIYAKVCGNTGTLEAPFTYGRQLTHESGHYLGLRHTWGDGSTCPAATDYCNDTPPEQQVTYYGSGTGNTTYVYPYTTHTCSSTGSYNDDLGDGIMYMNFMEYSDDAFMCLFTNDQLIRMQTALTQSPNRSGLTSSAVSVCTVSQTTPVSAFTYPTSICANGSTVFADASTGSPTAWTWSVTPSSGVVITTATSQDPVVIFPSSGSYSVTLVATNAAGSNSITHVVTVNASPTLTVNAATICNGTSATLSVNGASTYTWNTTATGASISVSPILTTTYTVTGTDVNNCTGNATSTVTVTNYDNLSGTIYDTTTVSGIHPITAGNVYLYKQQTGSTAIDTGALIMPINPDGTYTFAQVPPNTYYIEAIASLTTYTGSIPTYFSTSPNAYLWSSATAITHTGCNNGNDSGHDITIIELPAQTGTGRISGVITQDGTLGHRLANGNNQVMGTAVKGIDVKLGKNPGGGCANRTTTDGSGNYTFTNVSDGSYSIYADMPNFGMTNVLTVTISSANQQSTNNNYCVDSVKINTACFQTTGINQVSVSNEQVAVYPNPSNGTFTIETQSNVHCILYNVNGSEVLNKTINGKVTIDASNLSEGVYNLSTISTEGVVNKRVVIVK